MRPPIVSSRVSGGREPASGQGSRCGRYRIRDRDGSAPRPSLNPGHLPRRSSRHGSIVYFRPATSLRISLIENPRNVLVRMLPNAAIFMFKVINASSGPSETSTMS